MPYQKKYYPRNKWAKKTPYRKKQPAKWRQQKLAVGTVQKIARQIAKKEDKKNMIKYIHVTQFKAAALNWEAGYLAHLPLTQFWDTITGADDLYSKNFSNLGGNVEIANFTQNSQDRNTELELRVHGVELFGVLYNNSHFPARVEIRLLYIPNTNVYSDDANDYLTPRLTMFCHNRQGTGALQRQGYDYRALGSFSATGIPIRFTQLARKVMWLPPANVSGTITQPNPQSETGNSINPIILTTPTTYKRFSLRKYFKNPKKAFVRGTNPQLTNGNYYLCIWTDLPQSTSTISFLGTTNLCYSIKAPMNQDNI